MRAEKSGSVYSHTYHGDGLLVAETIDGAETVFTWDLALDVPQVLATSDGTKNLYGLDRIGVEQAGAWRYTLADALGSMRQWTDPAGAVLGVQSYGPFGEPRDPVGTPPWGFTGEWQDPAGMVYLRARWYNPTLGRFHQVDPAAGNLALPTTQHGYAYGLNNPLRYVDPSGEGPAAEAVIALILMLVGSGAAPEEYNQISAYAESHDLDFWEAAFDPGLQLDQCAMLQAGFDTAGRGLVGLFLAYQVYSGTGSFEQWYGLTFNDVQTFASGTDKIAGAEAFMAWLLGLDPDDVANAVATIQGKEKPWRANKYYYRYVGAREAESILRMQTEGGEITIESRSGATFFSPTRYVSAKEVRDYLALPKEPLYRVRVPAEYVDAASSEIMGIVDPKYAGFGGGWEIAIAGGIRVPADVVTVQRLRP